jgi:hypothetical protein
MLVPVLAFAAVLGLAMGASRLRSVAGLAVLVAAAYAGNAADPRAAALQVVLPAGLALLAADARRLPRRRRVAAAPRDHRPAPRKRSAGEPAR